MDGFPPPDQLRTVYVAHDIDASGAYPGSTAQYRAAELAAVAGLPLAVLLPPHWFPDRSLL